MRKMWSYLKYELRGTWKNLKDTLKQLGLLKGTALVLLITLFIVWFLITALAPVLPR